MIFYECKVSGGKQLAGTQADAKALDREFKQVDLPIDKAGYMGLVNGLYAEIAAKPGNYPITDDPVVNDIFKDQKAQDDAGHPVVVSIPAPKSDLPKDYRGHADDCPGCLRSAKAAKVLGAIDLRDTIADAVEIMDIDEVRRLQEVLDDRKKALTLPPKVQPVAPRPRVRKPVA